jgi:hypothetical protein
LIPHVTTTRPTPLLDERFCHSRAIAAAVQEFKIDIRHPHDGCDGGKPIDTIDIAGFVISVSL